MTLTRPSAPSDAISVSAAFDGGNILARGEARPGPDGRIELPLAIRPDAPSGHYQWFHFRLAGVRDQPLRLIIENAGGSSYPEAWAGYPAVRSLDRQRWERVPTRYEDGRLLIEDRPGRDLAWYAYFAPYSGERHQDLLARCLASGRVEHRELARTHLGRPLDHLRLGAGPRRVWVLGRQHPGETMASWWMEGFLGRLLDPADALARRLLREATLDVVPLMNPDGAALGHLRTNAVGTDLNRAWAAPDATASPEVLGVLAEMERTGVDLCLDVHGDEALPWVFLSGAEGIPRFGTRLAGLQEAFALAMQRANPDLQRVHGYPVAPPGGANLAMCTPAVAERFDCLAFTLEMPFKDNADDPDPVEGFSPARCARLGAAAVDAMVAVLGALRG